MKKNYFKFLLLSLVFGFMFSTPVGALKSAVYFEGGAENFVFYPGTNWSDTDLFDGFKNAMPGDRLEETIRVRNAAPEYDHVKIYLRAETHGAKNKTQDSVASIEDLASMRDFLSQLSMKVYNGADLIYDASPDQLDGLTENVLLGDFYDGNEKTLKVILEVPIELDNKYMHRVGEVDWIFTAEAFKDGKPCCCECKDCKSCENKPQAQDTKAESDKKTPINLPLTLDDVVKYLLIFTMSAAGLALIIFIIVKSKKDEEK